jgi:hypothetical protein
MNARDRALRGSIYFDVLGGGTIGFRTSSASCQSYKATGEGNVSHFALLRLRETSIYHLLWWVCEV